MLKENVKNYKIIPIGKRILVKPVEKVEQTNSGIILPDSQVQQKPQGTIIAKGTSATDELSVGDFVEWEHMDTLTYITGGAVYDDDASDIFIGNGTNGRFFVRSWDGKYYVALENFFELISLNTTDYVPNKRNKVS